MQRFTPRYGWRRRLIPVPWNLTRSTVTYLLFWYGCLLGIINLRVFLFLFSGWKYWVYTACYEWQCWNYFCTLNDGTEIHYLYAMNDDTEIHYMLWMMTQRFTICYEWWHRDSLYAMNDDAEIHYMLWMMTQRYTLCHKWWRIHHMPWLMT
jgi:hypothetical protein